MTKITGRPPKAVKREKHFTVYVTNSQYELFREKAGQTKATLSDYVREAALHGKVQIRWTEQDVSQLKKLVELSNDLHAVVQIAEREGAMSALLFFSKYRDKIDEVIKTMAHVK